VRDTPPSRVTVCRANQGPLRRCARLWPRVLEWTEQHEAAAGVRQASHREPRLQFWFSGHCRWTRVEPCHTRGTSAAGTAAVIGLQRMLELCRAGPGSRFGVGDHDTLEWAREVAELFERAPEDDEASSRAENESAEAAWSEYQAASRCRFSRRAASSLDSRLARGDHGPRPP
jgi:hypothetical protein